MTNSGREATAQYRADKAQSWGPWPICAGAALWRSRKMTESLSRTHRSRNRQACPHDRGVEGRGVRASITRYYIVMGCPVASLVGRPAFVARPASTTLGSTALRRWLRPDNAPALGIRVSPRRISSDRPPDRHPLAPREEPPSSAVVADPHGLPPAGGPRRRRRYQRKGAHLAPPHPGHEEEPRDHAIEAAARDGQLVGLRHRKPQPMGDEGPRPRTAAPGPSDRGWPAVRR